jgi:hypothetical protein
MIKTSYSPKVAFQKAIFGAKKGPKNFVGLKMVLVFSKTAPKMALKRIKNVVQNIYFL